MVFGGDFFFAASGPRTLPLFLVFDGDFFFAASGSRTTCSGGVGFGEDFF